MQLQLKVEFLNVSFWIINKFVIQILQKLLVVISLKKSNKNAMIYGKK